MPSDIYQLKETIEEAYPGDEPPWKAFGRIKIMTGVSLANIHEDDTVSDEEYEDVLEAAEEVTGETFSELRQGGARP
ncbi:MAG: hypothetical protein ACI8XM_002258 [Haloarculaceae archaeon]|jgi:hypothetical protein